MSPQPVKVFVYGSLREGFFNWEKALAGKCGPSHLARIKASLYHMPGKGYPAILPGEGWVTGELIEVDPALMPVLDEIENYVEGRAGNEYDRRLTPVMDLVTGLPTEAFVYWYALPLDVADPSVADPIPNGDWKAYMLKSM